MDSEPGGGKQAGEGARRTLFQGGVLSALGHRDYAILWTSELFSNVGTWVQTAALLWLIKNVLHSNSWVGTVNLVNFVPVMFLVPFTGALADRYDRRGLLILSEIIMMAGAFALAVAASFSVDNKAVILITVGVIGVGVAISFPAWESLLPDIVPREDVLNAIALSSAQWNAARLVGPLIAAAILAFSSPAVAFYINAVTFGFVIVALFFIRPQRAPEPTEERMMHSVLDGFSYAWDNRWMTYLLSVLSVVAFFGMSYIVLIPGLVQDVLHRGSSAYGVLLATTGLGAIVGSLLVSYLIRFVKEPTLIQGSFLSLGIMLVAFGLFRPFFLSCIASFGSAASFIVAGSAANAMLLNRSTRDMRGRVSSLFIIVYVGISAIGGVFLAYLSDVRSVPFSLALGGAVCIGVAALVIAFPRLVGGGPDDAWASPAVPG